MRRIGLTGGIACGKTTVSQFLQAKGIPLLDADQVARDVVQIGSKGLQEIMETFGSQYLLEAGGLNRIALRQRIIQDPTAKKKLEQITHPKIFKSILDWEKEQLLTDHKISIVDAALLIETGSYRRYDSIIVVRCDSELQIKRLMARNQISFKEASGWVATQMPLPEKENYADILVDNSGTLKELQSLLEIIWSSLLN